MAAVKANADMKAKWQADKASSSKKVPPAERVYKKSRDVELDVQHPAEMPHLYVIKNGKKLYEGAIDNDARGRKADGERVNYVSKALDELLAGKKVSTSYTKPYG